MFALLAALFECELFGECAYRRRHAGSGGGPGETPGSGGGGDGAAAGGKGSLCVPMPGRPCGGVFDVRRPGPGGLDAIYPTNRRDGGAPWGAPPPDPHQPDAGTGLDQCFGNSGQGPAGVHYGQAYYMGSATLVERGFSTLWLDTCEVGRLLRENFSNSSVSDIIFSLIGAGVGALMGGPLGAGVGGTGGALVGGAIDEIISISVGEALTQVFADTQFRQEIAAAHDSADIDPWAAGRAPLPDVGILRPSWPIANDGFNPVVTTIFARGKHVVGRYAHTQEEWFVMNPCALSTYRCNGEPLSVGPA